MADVGLGKMTSKERLLLALLLFVALGVRVWFLSTHVTVIEGEGAGYAFTAERLLHGQGFQSNLDPQPDLEHTLLEPVLIAGASFLAGNTERGAHVVGMTSGMVLIYLAFVLARRFYGESAGWIAALLFSFHPFLIVLSTSAYAEGLAFALALAGIYWSVRFIENDGRWAWLVAGVFWGLAYLNRTEILVVPIWIVFLYVSKSIWEKAKFGPTALQCAKFVGVFALVALPYVLFFHHYTGHFRFEGKNLLNYTIGQNLLHGMDHNIATRGITNDLQIIGPHLNTQNYVAYSPYPRRIPDLIKYFLQMANRNKYWIVDEIFPAFYLGSIVLFFLAFLGLVG